MLLSLLLPVLRPLRSLLAMLPFLQLPMSLWVLLRGAPQIRYRLLTVPMLPPRPWVLLPALSPAPSPVSLMVLLWVLSPVLLSFLLPVLRPLCFLLPVLHLLQLPMSLWVLPRGALQVLWKLLPAPMLLPLQWAALSPALVPLWVPAVLYA